MDKPGEISAESQHSIERYHKTLFQNLVKIRQRIEDVQRVVGEKKASNPRIIAVSKTHPPEAIKAAYGAGLLEFGENYAQELKGKWEYFQKFFPELLPLIKFVYQGRIQSNKIPLMVQYADEIQSVGSIHHALVIDQFVQKIRPGTIYPIWLLVNAGEETTKHGFSMEEIPSVTDKIIAQCPHLEIQGIMAIPPPLNLLAPSPSPEKAVEVPLLYRQLKELSRSMAMPSGKHGKLSLGMSEDLEVAIAAGTDCVRLGTALFGPRLPKEPVG